MMRTTPLRLITLHLAQMGLTEALTFMFVNRLVMTFRASRENLALTTDE